MTSNPFMIFPETADCGHIFLKITGRLKIVIILPGLFLIHACWSGPQICQQILYCLKVAKIGKMWDKQTAAKVA